MSLKDKLFKGSVGTLGGLLMASALSGTPAKKSENLVDLIKPTSAYAQQYYTADEIYNISLPSRDMYAGVRTAPYTSDIESKFKWVKIKPEEWYKSYFDGDESQLKNILKADTKINLPYLNQFFESNKSQIESLALFREGYLMVRLKNTIYMFPIEPSTVDKIEKL